MKKGLFIGRFQPFHNGHLNDVKEALKEVDEVIIAIGSAQYSNVSENPFTADERKEMIESALAKEGIESYKIFLVPDIHDDNYWVQHIEEVLGKCDVLFTGNPRTEELFSAKRYKVKHVKMVPGINGTTVRDMIIKDEDWKSLVPDSTVDVILRNDGVSRVKRVNG